MRVTRWFRSAFLLIGLTAAGCNAAGPEAATRAECEALRDHVVALQVAGVPVPAAEPEAVAGELAKHEQALADSLGEEFLAECAATRSGSYVDCALAARTSAAIAVCSDDDDNDDDDQP